MSEARPDPWPHQLMGRWEHYLGHRSAVRGLVLGRPLGLLRQDRPAQVPVPTDRLRLYDVFHQHDHILHGATWLTLALAPREHRTADDVILTPLASRRHLGAADGNGQTPAPSRITSTVVETLLPTTLVVPGRTAEVLNGLETFGVTFEVRTVLTLPRDRSGNGRQDAAENAEPEQKILLCFSTDNRRPFIAGTATWEFLLRDRTASQARVPQARLGCICLDAGSSNRG